MGDPLQAREIVVLLVEDDRDDFFLTQDLLKGIHRAPHRVVWAASYDAAKLELKERAFDVALVDYQIDGRTGLEFISQVGADYPHCPMILLTGLQDPGIDLAAQEAGAVDYLVKDSLTTELLDRSIRYARQNTQRFALLDRVLTNAAAGVISVTAGGTPIVWNRSATDALGLQAPRGGKITGAMVREALGRLMRDGTYPEEFAGSGGRSYQLSISEGPDGGTVFVFHDVSARARTERLLRQAAAEAEAASQAKSNFLATMSHELRTPLNGILGMTRVLAASRLDSSQRDHLAVIRASGESLLRIINDILDLSKIEAGKVTIEDVEFELAELIEDVVKMLAPAAYAKGLELTVFVDPLLPSHMRGDPLRIKQILTNLLGNAIKFTSTGFVQLHAVHDIQSGETSVHFTVSDTGCGIAPEDADLLFKRFSQVDSSHKRRHSGTGLGLALSSELARLMAAEVWYAPRTPSGSTFHFRLPISAEHKAVVQARTTAAWSGGQSCVLTITQSPAIASTAADYCTALGHTFAWAQSQDEVRAAIHDTAISCILMDWRVSGINLLNALEGARHPETRSRPALLLIDDYPARNLRAVGDLTCDELLARPFSVGLVEAINKGLRRACSGQPAPGDLAAGSPAMAGRLRILLVEDNGPNRLVATALLKSAGYALEIAQDGAEAVEKSKAHDFDVILMDVQMPKLDGITATTLIRAIGRHRMTPIIAVSAGASKKDREACIAAGMTEYLPKPIDWDELLSLLERIEMERTGAAFDAA